MSITILTLNLFFTITFQFVAALLALRLIRLTGERIAWSLISIALVIMTARRIIPFYHLLIGLCKHIGYPYAGLYGRRQFVRSTFQYRRDSPAKMFKLFLHSP
jgi:hypothetical protein